MAMNLVPLNGVADHLLDQILVKEVHHVLQAAVTYLFFEDDAGAPFGSEDPLYTTFGEFKAQY